MELKAMVELRLLMREGETEEQAANRLADLLWSELCELSDHSIDYWFNSTEVLE